MKYTLAEGKYSFVFSPTISFYLSANIRDVFKCCREKILSEKEVEYIEE